MAGDQKNGGEDLVRSFYFDHGKLGPKLPEPVCLQPDSHP